MKMFINRTGKWVLNALKLLTIELLIVLVLFFGCLYGAVQLIDEVFIDAEFTLDQAAIDYVGTIVSPGLTRFFSFITIIGSHHFLIPANLAIMVYAFFIIRNKWLGIQVMSIALSSLLLMFTLKQIFGRPRPAEPLIERVSGLSFPSGHAFMSFTFFGLLAFIVFRETKRKWLRYLLMFVFIAIAVLIALSRVYLNVHYTSDILAGAAMGIMWLVISLVVFHYMEKKKEVLPEVEEPVEISGDREVE